ncbi:testis-expressed protein 44 [Cricetulus griseus]|uniref:Testis-expressed protein 44 n=1 Tax=Cricetulus griseus TaxID=10029 RepID=G3IF82_CRIGR|nr:testis-expressed protein 44 [Cricetulus griseus]XP_027251785.1 testis-expressed protein 44 [Cricetulus griseus]EGW00586.1 Uncharacterized protein C2orf57-like [Cricetulus griseus]ERE86219.1 hypothetical protein H671_2g4635 [Cricetulus griseus]
MITEPWHEAEATSKPVYDLSEASVDSEADDYSADLPGEFQNSDYNGPPVESTTTLAEEKDVNQASVTTTIVTEQDEDQISTEKDTFTEQVKDRASIQNATSMEQHVDRESTKIATLIGPETDQASTQITSSMGQDEAQESKPITTSVGVDRNQASMQMATSIRQDVETAISMDMSNSGDKDENPDSPSHNQENPEEVTSLLSQGPVVPQMFVGFQNPVWDRLAENNRASRSRTVSASDSQNLEKTAEKLSVPEGEPETAAPSEDGQSSVGAADATTLDTSSPDQESMGITKCAEQEAEGVKASNPKSKARSQVLTREDLSNNSSTLQTSPPSPSSPAGSAPPSPDPSHTSQGRTLLDPSLYRPDVENDYMRSMTSLLGGGEGSISSLADILVWSDTATGMGLAVGFLASGRSSPADRLHDEGPSLHTVSSLLGSARSAFSSGLVAGTGSALRSVTHLLESVERRTVEGIRSAMRYLANHFTPRWSRAGPSSD